MSKEPQRPPNWPSRNPGKPSGPRRDNNPPRPSKPCRPSKPITK